MDKSTLLAFALVALALAGCGGTLDSGANIQCKDLQQAYTAKVWTPLVSARCKACHNPDGPARDTRMVYPPDVTAASSFPIFQRMALVADNGTPLVLLKATGRITHGGGAVVPEGSDELRGLEAVVQAINRCAMGTTACGANGAGASRRLRRLTLPELDATLAALGIDQSHAALALPADTLVKNFSNNADQLWVGPAFAQQYQDLVQGLAATAATNPKIIGCDPASAGEDACAQQFVATFTRRAWRRPLTADETATLTALFATGKSGGTFTDGVELVLEAVLQSPELLYHAELGADGATGTTGTTVKLSPYELAEALAYLATGGPPDDTLLALATGDTLAQADVREAQMRRLLDQGGRAQMARFVFSWLGLDKLDHTQKSAAVYPAFTPAIRDAMRAETQAFIGGALFDDDGTLGKLLTADYTYADATLAAYYGLDAPGAQPGVFAKVPVAAAHRQGILTQGSLLASYAQQDESAPVRRGHLVRSQLFCQDLPPPPPSLKITDPAVDATHTTRERFAQHTNDPVCSGCHQLMDPIGFGFEGFDGAGLYRAVENGFPVDTNGALLGTKIEGTFNGVAELGTKLAASDEVRTCLAKNLFRFTLGRLETDADQCLLDSVAKGYTADRPITSVLIDYVRSDAFVTRTVEQNQ